MRDRFNTCGQPRLSYGASVSSGQRSLTIAFRSQTEDIMASTRTPGITIDPDGRRIIDKEYRGVRICIRLGAITQEQAE
jgi:hypothetical protein